MEHSRRRVLKLAAVAAAAPTTILAAASPTSAGSRSSRTSWQQRVSHSVIENITNELATVVRRGRNISHDDLHASALATRIFIDHLNEIGFVEERESAVLDYLISPTPLPDDAITQFSNALQSKGVNVSQAALTQRLALDDDTRAEALKEIQKTGLRAMLARIPDVLDQLQSSSANTAAVSAEGVHATDIFDDTCRLLHLITDAILAVAALDALGCSFGCAPCCLIAIAFGVVGALMTLAVDFIC